MTTDFSTRPGGGIDAKTMEIIESYNQKNREAKECRCSHFWENLTATPARKGILGTVIALVLLTTAFLLTVHFHFHGFENFSHWLNNTQMTVGQGLAYIAAPVIGSTILIAALVKFIPHRKTITPEAFG